MLSATLYKNAKRSFVVDEESTDHILSVENILIRIQRINKNDNVSTNDICQIIAKNPILQFDIISVANNLRKSAGEITDIHYAILFLGMSKLESIIQSRVALMQ